MAKILVTGATGNVGRAVTVRLVTAGAGVRAFVRDARTARVVPGAEVTEGDLSAPETLDKALSGIEAVFLDLAVPHRRRRARRRGRDRTYRPAPGVPIIVGSER